MTDPVDRLTAALADRYRIERELGAGGMATVYLAEDLKHDRKVALKVLKPELAAVLGAERFVVEIKTTAALQHPHILPLFDSGTADGFLFYVMPYVEGETLRTKLNRETQFGVDEAVRISREVADALDYAHRHGVIHRDIKPENILLHDGRPMVADFGIALALSAAAGGRMTETGLSLGTPHYMSPEQATAEKEITARSDVYSLGSVLYEMLTGNPPHVGSSAQQIIMKIITEPAEAVTKYRKAVPPNVAAAVARSLEKLPADRFASAAAFAEALGNAAFTTYATTPGAQPPSAGIRRNRPAQWLGGLALIAAALAAWGWLRPAPPKEVSRYSVLLPEGQVLGSSPQSRVAIAPDGSVLVYVARTGNQSHLMARRRDALSAEEISGSLGAMNPFFSPDGTKLGFMQGAPRALRVVSLAGAPPVTLTDSLVDTGGAAWGYDGFVYYDGHLAGDGIARVSEAGGSPEPVTMPDSAKGEGYHIQPEPLPDGQGLLFTISRIGAGTRRWAIGATRIGSREHTVLFDGRVPRFAGGYLFFAADDGTLMAAPFDQGRLAATGPAVPVAEGIALRGLGRADLSFSRTGTVVYTSGSQTTGPGELMWVTRSGEVSRVDSSWKRPMTTLALSPDGRQVAFTVVEGDQADVWVKQLDRGPASKLSFGAPFNLLPFWSPDGKDVLFTSRGPDRTQTGLMRGPADGRTLPVLIRPGVYSGSRATISPDGQWIVYGNAGDIFGLRTTGDTAVVPLVRQDGNQLWPTLSPDGRWLAYASEESGQWQVYVTPFPDTRSAKRVVSTDGGMIPGWSRDGRELYWRTPVGELVAAEVLPGAAFAVGKVETLFSLDLLWPGGTESIVQSPDRSRFLAVRPVGGAEKPDELIVVENFLEEVRSKVKR